MPIYDYVCSSCSHRIEVIHGIHDAGPRFCPACGADGSMRKALSSPAIHFKGSGWAKKDRSSTSGTRSRAGGTQPAESGGGDAAESTTKAPAAAEPDKGAAGSATTTEG